MVQGIVECDLPVVQNGKPPALRKISIARVVLPTAGAWAAQFSGPPAIAWAGGNLRPGKASVNDGVSPRFAESTSGETHFRESFGALCGNIKQLRMASR